MINIDFVASIILSMALQKSSKKFQYTLTLLLLYCSIKFIDLSDKVMGVVRHSFSWNQIFMSISDVNKENVIDKLKKALDQDIQNESRRRILEAFYKMWQDGGFDIDFMFGGETLLYTAVINSNIEVARALVGAGASIGIATDTGKTPLHGATDKALVDFIVEAGADVEAVDDEGCTPLCIAAIKNDAKIAEALIEKGAKVNTRSTERQTPLHIFSEHNQPRMINVLIANASGKKAYINAMDEDKRTALHITAIHNNVEAAKALIKAGAKVDTKDINGQTPLHIFSKYDQARIINDLIASAPDKAAYINAVDMNKCTPLHIAVEHKRIDVIRALMASGADPTLKTQYSKKSMKSFKKNYEQELMRNRHDIPMYVGLIAACATLVAMPAFIPVAATATFTGYLLSIGVPLCIGVAVVPSCEEIRKEIDNLKSKQWLKEFEAKNNKTPRELADSEEIRKLLDTERQKYLNGLRGQAHSVSPATIIETEEIHEQKKGIAKLNRCSIT